MTYGTRAETQFSFNDASVQTLDLALKTIGEIKYTRTYTFTCPSVDELGVTSATKVGRSQGAQSSTVRGLTAVVVIVLT